MEPKPSQRRSQRAAHTARVSAIVVTHHTGQPLELCLRGVLAEPWIDELVIVDLGNPTVVASALRALQADRRDVKLIQGVGSISRSAAANLGAARAKGRWLLFLDPTVVLQRGAVEQMVAAGGDARSPWIIGGRLTDTLGREQRAARRGALNAWSAASVALGLPGMRAQGRRRRSANGASARRGGPPPAATAKLAEADPIPVASVSGSFMLIPREDFLDLGAFDEGFATDGQDLDLCRRVTEAGGAIRLQPSAAAVRFTPGRRADARRREAQGLARLASKSARTPLQRAFAIVSWPVIALCLTLRGLTRRLVGVPLRR